MFFASDNGGAVPQQVLDALARANEGAVPGYGADALSRDVCDRIRALFEAPEAAVYLVPTGTAANSLALASLCPPWGTVFCSPVAHIHADECNAPEFFTGGAKLTLVPGSDRIDPEALRHTIEAEETRGVHGPERGPVSITQLTEHGNIYSRDELAAICDVARDFGLPVHMDGARFSNACVKLGLSPAEMTWKAGVDVAVFGGTKNGLMGVEAVIFFDPAHAAQFERRRKRGAHLFSKHRYLAAQMDAYLRDDLWRDMAQRANGACDRLAQGLKGAGLEFENDTWGNMLFVRMPRSLHRALHDKGAVYSIWDGTLDGGSEDEMLIGRLVCGWNTTAEDVAALTDAVRAA